MLTDQRAQQSREYLGAAQSECQRRWRAQLAGDAQAETPFVQLKPGDSFQAESTLPKKSAGLLLYRRSSGASPWQVMLVHPGGPFWRNKDQGAWSIPKGEFNSDEDPLAAALREFGEETGAPPPRGDFIKLRPVRQSGGKIVHAWAIEADFDPSTLHSNEVQREWPPKSGRIQRFPEVDRAAWYEPELARQKILSGQVPLIDELLSLLKASRRGG